MTELIKIQRNLEKEAWPESKTNQQIWNSMILSQKVLHWPINSSKKQTSNLPIKYTRTELMQTPVITQVNEGKKVSPRKQCQWERISMSPVAKKKGLTNRTKQM